MTVFTLRNKMTGEVQKTLNGKLVIIIRNKNKTLQIVDITTRLVLVNTTEVISVKEKPDGITFLTESGSVYDFVAVSTLIPTKSEPENVVDPVESKPYDFNVVLEEREYEPIYYGDGYDTKIYTFDREITENEFRKFLDHNGVYYNLEQKYPYQDYHKITGNGKKWILKKILCYTD